METNLTSNKSLLDWLDEKVELLKPSNIVWIDGSKEQIDALKKEAVETGEMIKLNDELLPDCYLHRTAENDVARVEDRTLICTTKEEDAGPTNHWMAPDKCYKMLYDIAAGSYEGRTMYIIPYSMGPVGSPMSKIGIEITDSIYVVLNMNIMTRIGKKVLDTLGDSNDWVRGMHCKCNVDPEKRWICQFPEDNTIISVNSAYGGNVLLGKKCFALRIASYLGKNEGWQAEHMLILGLQKPNGEIKYICAAFPSACGKTNLAMLIPPEGYQRKGYKVWCVGDDISWIKKGPDGRLYAINPENGFFGVAPVLTKSQTLTLLLLLRRAQSSPMLLSTLTTTQFGGKVLTRTHLQTQLTGRVILGTVRQAKKRALIQTQDLQLLLLTALAFHLNLRTLTVFLFQHSYSVAVVLSSLHLYISQRAGTTVYS